MFDVITIGAGTRDVFLLSKEFHVLSSNKFEGGKAECVTLGAKIDIEECVLTTGGGATNAATTFARLGFLTSTITRVGNDEPGRAVLEDLTREHVDTSLIKAVKDGQTGYSTLLTTTTGERTVLIHRGVSANFAASDFPGKTLKSNAFYITSLGGNFPLLEKVIAHAKKIGAKVAVNPGHGEISEARKFRELLKDIDMLIVNLEEAQQLLQKQAKDGKVLSGELAQGKTLAIVTDGQNGAYAAQGKTRYYARNRSIKSISRTGAGDAFGSGFVAGMMKGLTVEQALQIGTLNAESVIGHIGAKVGILKKWPKEKELAEIKVFTSRAA